MPYRLHPLWYSPILPLLFLVSAIALGLTMVIFESHFTAYLYRRKPETEVLASFGGACRWVLLLYLAVRFADLLVRGQAAPLFVGNWRTALFWFEIPVMALIPIALLLLRGCGTVAPVNGRRRPWRSSASFSTASTSAALPIPGRMALSICRPGPRYAISAGVVSAAALAFLFVMEHFKVWEERPADPDADPLKLPEFDPVGTTWLGVPGVAARTTYSLAFILAAAAGFGLLRLQPAASRGDRSHPGPTRARRRCPVDRRQPGRLRRRVQARGAREAGRRKRVLREMPSHEPAPGRRYRLCALPPGHVSAGRRLPARLARIAHRSPRWPAINAT